MFLGNVFFVSLAITFALLLLLVYHFQQRFTQLERRCDLLYELSTNLVGQVKVMRSSSSANATATDATATSATTTTSSLSTVLFEPKVDHLVKTPDPALSASSSMETKKDEQAYYDEYDSDESFDSDSDDDDDDEDEDDDDEEHEDDEQKAVELKLAQDPLDVVAHDLLTDIFAQGQGQGQGQGLDEDQVQEEEKEEDKGQGQGQGQGQCQGHKNDDTISIRSANVSQLRSQAVNLQLVSLAEATKMKKKDLQRLLIGGVASSTLPFASVFEVEETLDETPAEEV